MSVKISVSWHLFAADTGEEVLAQRSDLEIVTADRPTRPSSQTHTRALPSGSSVVSPGLGVLIPI
jgi:hypothetical protein